MSSRRDYSSRGGQISAGVQMPGWYLKKLDQMDLVQLAIEAARYRSDKKRKGICTELIIDYTRDRFRDQPEELKRFETTYTAAVAVVLEARRIGRPQNRPIMHVKGPNSALRIHIARNQALRPRFGTPGMVLEAVPATA